MNLLSNRLESKDVDFVIPVSKHSPGVLWGLDSLLAVTSARSLGSFIAGLDPMERHYFSFGTRA